LFLKLDPLLFFSLFLQEPLSHLLLLMLNYDALGLLPNAIMFLLCSFEEVPMPFF
jgi:hypothetical protein